MHRLCRFDTYNTEHCFMFIVLIVWFRFFPVFLFYVHSLVQRVCRFVCLCPLSALKKRARAIVPLHTPQMQRQ